MSKADVVERAMECVDRLCHRMHNATGYKYQSHNPDGSEGYDVELDGRSAQSIRDLLAIVEKQNSIYKHFVRVEGVIRVMGPGWYADDRVLAYHDLLSRFDEAAEAAREEN